MASIARLHVPPGVTGATLWPAVAAGVTAQARAQGWPLRDVVVLLPFAALIEPLRSAFAAQPGWQPRVETTRTLAAALGPADEVEPGRCSGDAALDRLQAERWLGGWPAAAQAERAHAAGLLADAAAQLQQAAAQQPPAQRDRWWQDLLATLPAPADGPGALEAALLRAAAAWAAETRGASTDRLFAQRPAAWVVVQIGGPDALAQALLERGGGALVALDPDPGDPFAPFVGSAPVQLLQADDFESEAWAAAHAVLRALGDHPGDGDGRVALVALDRVLARRVVALLQRAGAEVDDETGWKLSTQAAAGRVLARLRAAAPQARGDERLDWLKRWPLARARPQALRALEAVWRGGRNARLGDTERAAAEALWAEAQRRLDAWQGEHERGLADWLQLLVQQLDDDGEADELAADDAGAQLLQLLRVQAESNAWRVALRATRVDLAGFGAWFESLCESTTLQHAPRPRSRVVLTPLARAVGRPFAQVVLAGADRRPFGAAAPDGGLIGDALAARLGLPTQAERRVRQRLALAQLLRGAPLTVLCRRHDGDTLLGPAPELQWMLESAHRQQLPWAWQAADVPRAAVRWLPVARPLPVVDADALPRELSASAIEALRDCPYRFFARSVLRLTEIEEIERDADKRDWGDWLHLALHRFHVARAGGAADDDSALPRAADEAAATLQLDAAEMLAFRATLARVLRGYRQWLAGHEAGGWRWQAGEEDHRCTPPGWAPHGLRGRIDRIDAAADGRRLVIDYKTSRATALRRRVREPLEDTQLACYAALLAAGDADAPVQAAYLALDEGDGPQLIVHDGVAASAAIWLQQLGGELQRVRGGAPLPALGDGAVCERCEARGLCRRDHWAEPPR
ncbi:MAG: PD-(D/E)XK nuclease family protein [Rubrivivax sp.]